MDREDLILKIFKKITRDIDNLLVVAILETEELEKMYYNLYSIA